MNKIQSKKILLLPIAVIFLALLATTASAVAPVFVTDKIPDVRANIQFTYQINVTDENVNTVTFSVDNKGWTTFQMDSTTGIILFTATDDDIGFHTITITAKDAETPALSTSKDFTVFVTDEYDDSKLLIKDVEIDDVTDDEDDHAPGDYLDISFTLDSGSRDLSDVEAKVWIENSAGTKVGERITTDKDDLDSDSRDETVTLRIDPTAKAGTTYTLYIKAEGTYTVDDSDVSDLYAEKITIKRDGNKLLIENVVISPPTVTCGTKAQLSATIYNIGEDREDDIKLRIRNSEMNIDVYSQEFELKDYGSTAKTVKTLMFDIPVTAKGTYMLEVSALFNGGSDATSTIINVPVTCSTTGTTQPGITGTATISLPTTFASAESGQMVKFTATIKNSELTAQNYQIALSGTSDWAAANIEPSDVTLAPGAETPVYVYLTPKSSAYGDQVATLSIKSGATVLATKTLTVNMPQKLITTVTQKPSTSPMADIELSDEAKVAIAVGMVLIAAGFLYMKYRAEHGIKIYGNGKKGKGRRVEEE